MPLKQKKAAAPPDFTPPSLSFWGKSPLGEVTVLEWTGKCQGKQTVAYRFRLPRLKRERFFSAEQHLLALRDAFFLFLQEQADKEEGEVLFGGLDFYFEEERLILCAAFGPFGRRQFLPRLAIRFDDAGEIREIERYRQRRDHSSRSRQGQFSGQSLISEDKEAEAGAASGSERSRGRK